MPRLTRTSRLPIGSSASLAFRRLLDQLEEEHCRALAAARSQGKSASLAASPADEHVHEETPNTLVAQASCISLAATDMPSPTEETRRHSALTTSSSVRFTHLPSDQSTGSSWDLKLPVPRTSAAGRNTLASEAGRYSIWTEKNTLASEASRHTNVTETNRSTLASESTDYSFAINTFSGSEPLRPGRLSGRSGISNLPDIEERPTAEHVDSDAQAEVQQQRTPGNPQVTRNEGVPRASQQGTRWVSEGSEKAGKMRASISQTSYESYTNNPLAVTARSPLGNTLSWKGGGTSRRVSQLEYDTCYQRISNMAAKRQITKERLRASIDAQKHGVLAKFCDFLGDFCEGGVSAVIILNGMFIGVQTDYHARNVTDEVPKSFIIAEIVFCLIFMAELIVKLLAYRLKFFYMKDWAWNWFDALLVIAQVVDVTVMLTSEQSESVSNNTMLQVLRVMRMSRVFRLVRLLHYIGELATIISSITNSLRALGWTVVLLLMMIYMSAIFFTQIVTMHRIGLESDSEMLSQWWGSLSRSALSLYQAILGGVDWQFLTYPLEQEIHTLCAVLFYFYIAFALLAMLNIFTGTFVQSALRAAENERTRDFRHAAQSTFMPFGPVLVSYMEFEHKVQNAPFKDWLDSMGILTEDAKLLFKLLQTQDYEPVQSERLISAMVSLREGAKFLDIMKLMYALRLQTILVEQIATKGNTRKSENVSRFSIF